MRLITTIASAPTALGARMILSALMIVILAGPAVPGAGAAEPPAGDGQAAQAEQLARLVEQNEALRHRLDELQKGIDDVLWYDRVGDVAVIDKVRIYGPPRWREDNPDGIGAGNPVKLYCYVLTPSADLGTRKLPLLVLPHGGVHADFTTYYAHIVRELVAQGYIVVAPEYRGSTGYGGSFYRQIDYGGREVEDCLAARDWAVANHPRVDPDRVGILGWSHGGLITLMSLFNHPGSYVCGFAGVPVADLVLRMGYLDQGYRDYYEADYHIGQSVMENLAEYKRRSPVWNASKLERPLRIHTNPNDEDVNYIEVEHLIQALKAEGKDFEYQVYDVPGGHSFDRLDTPEAWQARRQIYAFLARYLDPPHPEIELGLTSEGRAAP
jgi:dipeptidyl aminopeptidase/acylaminoacyl peptidase